MTGDDRRAAGASDPARLVGSGTDAADLLKAYARRTRPGDRDGVAAWYRLRSRLRPPPHGVGAGLAGLLPRRWTRAYLLSSVLTAALGLFVLEKLVPSRAGRENAAPGSARALEGGGGPGFGGASGSIETVNVGVGGMEGAGGTEGAPGTEGGPEGARGTLGMQGAGGVNGRRAMETSTGARGSSGTAPVGGGQLVCPARMG